MRSESLRYLYIREIASQINEIATKLVRLGCDMNMIHNRHVPSISKLPIEIMGSIFSSFIPAPDIFCAVKTGPTLTDASKVWRTASSVCRSWRAAVLTGISPWSTILVAPFSEDGKNYGDPAKPSIRVWRCFETAPTTAICDIEDPRVLPTVKTLIGPYSEQLRKVRVDFQWRDSTPGSEVLSSVCGPKLQVLALQGIPSDQADEDYTPAELDPSFLSRTQTLRVFVLRGFTITPAAQFPSALRLLCLSIRGFKDHEALRRMFMTLASLAALEELSISYIFWYNRYRHVDEPLHSAEAGPSVDRPSTLSSPLKRLLIRDEANRHNDFIDSGLESLARIHVPDTCPLVFLVSGANPRLSPVVKSRFAQAERVYLGADRMIAVCGTLACCATNDGFERSGVPCPEVRELWLSSPASPYIPKMCFANVDELVVIVGKYEKKVDWEVVGSTFRALKSIRVLDQASDTPIDGLFAILKARKDCGSPIQSVQFIRKQAESCSDDMDKIRQRYERICADWSDVVDSVSYEIVDKLPTMEVPVACTRPDDVYSVWNADLWDSNVSHISDRGQF